MIIDAILLAVAEISADITSVSVAILPLLRLADGDGINIVNPETGFQLCLIGDTDYGLYTYLQESDQSYALDTAADTIASYAHNCVPLVTGKREDQPLYDSMPEAVSQAIVLSEIAQAKAVRFCLSDGWNWIFSLVTKDEHGNRVYYEGEKFSIIKPRPSIQGVFEDDVHQIVALVYHWLIASDDPLSDLLYTLKDAGRCY
ncbi:hypothetical protein BD779DRAFT_1680078 [Infundibulicybe gibba]|nr:hypothetical protein BD779DRAFT_1680078 [Infundibulicybe gibba]